MSKRNLEGENDENEMRTKYASLRGFSEKTAHQRLKNLEVTHKGDWRRCIRIRVPFKLIRNEDSEESEIFTITTPVPTEMVGLMRKLQEAAGRSYQSVPVSVKGHFKLSKENFNSKDFTTETMFENNEQHGLLYHLYCKFCKKTSLKIP